MEHWEAYKSENDDQTVITSVAVNGHEPGVPFKVSELTLEQLRELCKVGLYIYHD